MAPFNSLYTNSFLLLSSLVEGRVRLEFPLTDSKAVRQDDVNSGGSAAATAMFESASNKQLKDIEEKCRNDLLEICNTIASEKKITVSSLINMQAVMAMAEKLPMSEEEMMNIPHVTKANYEKVCKQLLPVTRHYAAMRMAIMVDLDEKEAEAMQQQQQHNDSTDWGQLANNSSSSTPAPAGVKRRRGWITNLPSQRSRAGRKTTRRATPKKRAAAGGRQKRGRASGTPSRAAATARRTQATNLMPVPGPSTNRW